MSLATEMNCAMNSTRTLAAVLTGSLALVALTACSDDAPSQDVQAAEIVEDSTATSIAEAEVVEPDQTAEAPENDSSLSFGAVVTEAMTAHGSALSQVAEVNELPISPDFMRSQSERAVEAIDLVLADLPEDPGTLTGPGASEYVTFRTALLDWREYSVGIIADVDRDYAALAELADSWDGNSAPPSVFIDAVDGHMITWIPLVEQSCAAFAVAAEVTPGCLFGQRSVPDRVREVELQTVVFDGVTIEIDPIYPATDVLVEPGGFIVDYGPGFGTFALVDPPAVADPDAVGLALDATIPWPNNVDAWLASLPVEVVSAIEGEFGSNLWQVWHVRADEQISIIDRVFGPAWTVGDTELHIYQTDLEGTTVVGVLEISPLDLDRTDEAVDDIAAVLGTIVVP